MSLYELLTLLHISAAIIWLGAGFVVALLVFGAERAGDALKQAGFHEDVGWLAPRLFIPASLLTLVFGIGLVLEGSWGFDQLWINIAMVGWFASFFVGLLYFKPEGEKIATMVAERGPTDPEATRRLHRLNVIDRIQVLTLFIVVADMVLKPASADTGVLVVGGAVLAAAIAFGAASISKHRGAGSPTAV